MKPDSVTVEVPPPAPFHTLSGQEVVDSVQSAFPSGLTHAEATLRHRRDGPNEFSGKTGPSALRIFFGALVNAMNLILLVAFIFGIVAKDWVEAGVIAFIIVTNTGIAFYQEYRSEKTMEALRKMSKPTAKVIREGLSEEISSSFVVKGDLITVSEGDSIPADCRFLEVMNLEVDEALLTGENLPVKKHVDPVHDPLCPLGDRRNLGFKNTTVTKGRGTAVVISIGMQTEIGKIAKMVQEEKPTGKTQLQRHLNYMMIVLLLCAVVLAVIVFGVNKFEFDDDVLLYAIALAVAIIPEGLPVVVTVTMAIGVRTMAKQNAIVRNPASLEGLGQVTDICSDKTGTLTVGKMTATEAWTAQGAYQVEGEGIGPKGKVTDVATQEPMTPENIKPVIDLLALCCTLCNTSTLFEKEGTWTSTGDPTEVALVVLARKLGKVKETLEKRYQVEAECPFDSAVKRMTAVMIDQENPDKFLFFTKGAVEATLACSTNYYDDKGEIVPMSDEYKKQVLERTSEMASKGLRVLGFAYRETKRTRKEDLQVKDRPDIEADLTFLGIVGMYDPPRPQSAPSVEECYTAGICVHMATGDHLGTATAIAKQIGILKDGDDDSLVMEARDFDTKSDQEIDDMPELPRVLARCSPETKVKLINALHRRKRYCAMTGDGVNDAPAIKKADIGIAMGLAGSDVTKQASDIILTDDNFATIVAAIAVGRQLFVNIGKFALHLLSGNIADVVCLVIGLVFIDLDGRSIYPMSPTQILWLNLVTSSPIALLLGIDPSTENAMTKPPRGKEGLFSKELIADTFYYGVVMGIVSLLCFMISVYVDGTFATSGCNEFYTNPGCDVIFQARGACFVSLYFIMLLHGFNCRSTRRSMFQMDHRKNWKLIVVAVVGVLLVFPLVYVPYVNTEIFHHGPLGWEWGLVFASLVIYQICVEVYKFGKRRCCRS